MAEPGNKLFCSAASIWEIAIKRSLGRPGFATDPRLVRSELSAQDDEELPITSDHGVVVDGLAFIHKDPFDGSWSPRPWSPKPWSGASCC